ncbi:MAG TPA: ribonuclease P protein component [Acidimicrobiales bacterium]|nr:ribonuclease P protein component [Acidimicrobiales bacterium]
MVWRVRDRTTFSALRRAGARVRRGPVTVTFVSSGQSEPPKVAYAVGRKVGTAVRRNRLRRRLRAVVADLAPEMRPGAYLLSAAPEAAEVPFRELRAAVAEAVRAVGEK